jgi:hypothetical protein
MLVIALMVVIMGIIPMIKTTGVSHTKTGWWLLYLSFVPPLLLFLFSQWQPVYIERALLPSGVMFCIWLAWVVMATKPARFIQYALMIMLSFSAAIGIFQHVTYRDVPYGPFKELGASLQARVEPNDVIVHASKMSMLPVRLFDRTLAQQYVDDPGGSGQDTLAPATQEVLKIKSSPYIASAIGDAERVWFIAFARDLPNLEANQDPASPFQYLNSQFEQQSVEEWDGLRVFLYVQK